MAFLIVGYYDAIKKAEAGSGDAIKYWKWPPYSLKGQRSLLHKLLYVSCISIGSVPRN